MLVLSGRKDRSIIIVGENAEARIVDVRGNMNCPEITASRPIPIHRRELYEAISREITDKARFMLVSSS